MARGLQVKTLTAVAGATAVLVGVGLRLRPLSVWLLPFTVDGALQAETARFLDTLWVLPLGLGAMALTAAASRSLRDGLGAGWRGPGPDTGRSWVLPLAVATLAARLLVGRWSDVGLGDDGARVAWLLHWLTEPRLVPTELWAPGHLYLSALVWLVVRDALWAGIVLGAMASAGTVLLLGRAVQRAWGASAASLAALFVAVLPVASAHGATPDVNPVFAFLCVAALLCVCRAASGRAAWLWLAWILLFFASWSRFESIFLVPAFALPLVPRWRRTALFAAACVLPALLWSAALYGEHGDFLHVFRTLRGDPTLARPLASQLFDYFWAIWLAIPLPVLVLGILGVAVTLRSQRGWEFVPLLVLHLASLLAATWSTGTGNQPRHFILAGSLLAASGGIFMAGMLQRSRRWGGIALAVTLLLVPVLPALFSQPGELWIRRSQRLRAVVDCVAVERAALGLLEAPLVWIADEAGYFFLCRQRQPLRLYHAMSRAESDPQKIAAALRGAAATLVCVRDNEESQRRWEAFRSATAAHCEALPQGCGGYRLFRCTDVQASGQVAPGSLAARMGTCFSPPPAPVPMEPKGSGDSGGS